MLGGLRARRNEIKARSSRPTWKNCSLWLCNVHCWNSTQYYRTETVNIPLPPVQQHCSDEAKWRLGGMGGGKMAKRLWQTLHCDISATLRKPRHITQIRRVVHLRLSGIFGIKYATSSGPGFTFWFHTTAFDKGIGKKRLQLYRKQNWQALDERQLAFFRKLFSSNNRILRGLITLPMVHYEILGLVSKQDWRH